MNARRKTSSRKRAGDARYLTFFVSVTLVTLLFPSVAMLRTKQAKL
jgi:hypothetical protein